MKTKQKEKHYGKLLSKAISEKGLKKIGILKKLGMSKPTLNTRLIDGDFTIKEKELIDKYYL
jgi:hypothetical protein